MKKVGFREARRKQIGRWGEASVDAWMLTQGWSTLVRNHHFRGGELDRLYVQTGRPGKKRRYCVVEVKSRFLQSASQLDTCLRQSALQTLFRPHQLRNCLRFAETLEAVGVSQAVRRGGGGGKSVSLGAVAAPAQGNAPGLTSRRIEVHLRVFFVVGFHMRDGLMTGEDVSECGGRLCLRTSTHYILSFTPEFVARGSATSPCQIEV